MTCEFWTQDTSELYRYSDICNHYGRFSGKCYRDRGNLGEAERLPLCRTNGKREGKNNA